MPALKNLTNKRFGRLMVVDYERRLIGKKSRIYWNCVCDCGGRTSVEASNLVSGHAVSCGCFQQESRHFHTRTHGLSKTRTYKIWKGLKKRCYNTNNRSYKNYGQRGITVCRRWASFQSFLKDMGECPSGMSIDRIKNNKGYSPDNCRWSTHHQQMNNMRTNNRIRFNGQTKTLAEWSVHYKIPYHRLWQRLYILNWRFSKAIKT